MPCSKFLTSNLNPDTQRIFEAAALLRELDFLPRRGP
jgi:hypothetical protein